MVVRRRPLLRAAAVGGTFAAGRAVGRRANEREYADASQDQRISDLEGSQGGPPPMPQADPAAQAQGGASGAGSSVLDQLSQLTTLHEQGALSDDEFAAAKAKVLGGG
jgi:hypothetical protein